MSTFKSVARRKVVKNRWKARTIWNTVINEMPEFIEVLNNKDGERAPCPQVVDIKATVDWLRVVGEKIFIRNEGGHYVGVSVDDPKRISYCYHQDHKYSTEQRRVVSIQRYLGRNFEGYAELNERAVEMFVEKFKRESVGDIDRYFKVVRGNKIVDYYKEGWGKHTCMTGGDAYLTRLYAINDDVCSLLVFENEDGEVKKGRALLWEAEDIETGNVETICDRVYPNGGPHLEIFKAYCDKRGIPQRIGNSHPRSKFSPDYPDDIPVVKFSNRKDYRVRIIPLPDGDMPFTDSLHWGTVEGSTILLTTNPLKQKAELVYNSTSGCSDDMWYPECKHCGDDDCTDLRSCDDGYWWHTECYDEAHYDCGKCSYTYRVTQSTEVRVDRDDTTELWCHDCVSSYSMSCYDCGEHTRSSLMNGSYCRTCSSEHEQAEVEA